MYCKPAENSDIRPVKLRSPGCLENSDPRNSDLKKLSQLFFIIACLPRIASRRIVKVPTHRFVRYFGILFVDTMSWQNLQREGEKSIPGGRFLCSDHENNTRHSYVVFGCFHQSFRKTQGTLDFFLRQQRSFCAPIRSSVIHLDLVTVFCPNHSMNAVVTKLLKFTKILTKLMDL